MDSKDHVDKKEIIIVEDSPTQAAVLKTFLEKQKYHVLVAYNGKEALALLEKHKPVIVISDIVMPEMDGYQLCRLIKDNENTKDIPIILLTALSDPQDVLKGLVCGADNFITKPYNEKYLISRIHYLRTNRLVSTSDKLQMGLKVFFKGQEYPITSGRQQILNLLFSTYETAVEKNFELLKAQEELRAANERLEEKVEKRTAALKAEIEQRKRAQELINNSLKEKEALLREIHHRVKNNMQIISSLLRLESSSLKDKKSIDMYKDIQNRIITMSLIHEKLYNSGDLARIDIKDYIRDLVTGLFETYGFITGKVALKIDAENVSLGINPAIPCGLIINEIVSNSLKYAFPGEKTGEIKINLRSIEGNYIELIVSDNGIGLPKDMDINKTDSWGLRLVSILAEKQLQGELSLNRNNGTEFKIKFKDMG